MNSNRNTWIVIGIVAGILGICLCLVVVSLGGLGFYLFQQTSSTGLQPTVHTEIIIRPTWTPQPVQPQPISTPSPLDTTTPNTNATLPAAGAEDTLKTLQQAQVPDRNLVALAEDLKGETNIPLTETPPPAPLKIGDRHTFWASNEDDHSNFKVNASLQGIADHVYFWVEDGVQPDQQALKTLVDTFETKIYPTDRQFFGSEWTPGVDDDPHLYILYAGNLGQSIAGYFAGLDEFDPRVHQYSNAHEMFFINSDVQVDLSDPYTFSTLAHEFQHMIHWYRDRNEDTWMNEGFSVLAEILNGYNAGGFDIEYARNPDLQLNDWPNDPQNDVPHYGAAFLYLTYALDRLGENVTKDIVGNPLNGLESIDNTLSTDKITDKATGKTLTAEDLFRDWAVTNYLQDPSVGDGRYTYHDYPSAPQTQDTETISRCPTDTQARDVHQYGVDYIRFSCQGNYTLEFTGTTQVGVLAEQPKSGQYMFWSNKGDDSDMTLSQTFDFSGKSGPITMQYSTWYDIEKNYDYTYVEARQPGGKWQILHTPAGTDVNPSGNGYGWGYTGTSGGWVQQQVDLSQFAGKQAEVRFQYITDEAVNGEGFLLDDISIPQIGYQTDFEKDEGGWKGAGFVRLENALPQTYKLALILKGAQTTVQDIELTPGETASIPLQISGNVNEAILVVSGTTRFTRQLANYQFSVK